MVGIKLPLVGMPVTVKFTAFDYSRYGGIEGKVLEISPTTLSDDIGAGQYKVLISLDKGYVGNDSGKMSALPGMTVQADIKTGKKTILEYLFKPIHLSLMQAFHER